MKNRLLILLVSICILGCNSDNSENPEIPNESIYFPPNNSSNWETITPTDLNWKEGEIAPLLEFVGNSNSKAFIILHKGRIGLEWYSDDFSGSQKWYWASAGKTLTAAMLGIAQQEGFLEIDDQSNLYLGNGWTDATQEQEDRITIFNQLTMTSGLNDLIFDCTDPNCLKYKTDPMSKWAYHNGPYTLLQNVLSNAAGTTYDSYFNTKLRDKIGMNGSWLSSNSYNSIYFSTARSMARFGLLALNKGTWNGEEIINPIYFDEMTTTSQNLNKSYGYLWWLNGKDSFMLPQIQTVFNQKLIPNAPDDLIAGLGKNDQKLYVIPSLDMVVIRMGEAATNDNLVPISFDNELWSYINKMID